MNEVHTIGIPMNSVAERRLFLIRGLPKSGKGTLATWLAGGHRYSPEPNSPASEEGVLVEVVRKMTEGVTPIAVSHTFVQQLDMHPYFEVARTMGYLTFVVECQNNFGGDPDYSHEEIADMQMMWENHRV